MSKLAGNADAAGWLWYELVLEPPRWVLPVAMVSCRPRRGCCNAEASPWDPSSTSSMSALAGNTDAADWLWYELVLEPPRGEVRLDLHEGYCLLGCLIDQVRLIQAAAFQGLEVVVAGFEPADLHLRGQGVASYFIGLAEGVAGALQNQRPGAQLGQVLGAGRFRFAGGLEGVAEADQPGGLQFVGQQARHPSPHGFTSYIKRRRRGSKMRAERFQ